MSENSFVAAQLREEGSFTAREARVREPPAPFRMTARWGQLRRDADRLVVTAAIIHLDATAPASLLSIQISGVRMDKKQ